MEEGTVCGGRDGGDDDGGTAEGGGGWDGERGLDVEL